MLDSTGLVLMFVFLPYLHSVHSPPNSIGLYLPPPECLGLRGLTLRNSCLWGLQRLHLATLFPIPECFSEPARHAPSSHTHTHEGNTREKEKKKNPSQLFSSCFYGHWTANVALSAHVRPHPARFPQHFPSPPSEGPAYCTSSDI